MQGAEAPSSIPRTLFAFNSKVDLQQFATGCDSDIGGTSTVHFDLDESPEINASIGKSATARFWGDMRLGVRAGLEGKLRGGYAGFRNKVCHSKQHGSELQVMAALNPCMLQPRPTLFGNMVEDVSNHRYLALRLRVAGDPRTHNSYFANIQTDGPISTDLWQHRLYFKRHDNAWEDIFVSRVLITSLRGVHIYSALDSV